MAVLTLRESVAIPLMDALKLSFPRGHGIPETLIPPKKLRHITMTKRMA